MKAFNMLSIDYFCMVSNLKPVFLNILVWEIRADKLVGIVLASDKLVFMKFIGYNQFLLNICSQSD